MRIAIIGTGPAGSYAAYLANKQGYAVDVFEKEAWLGGRAASYRKDGFTLDTGAAFLTNFYKRVFELAPALGIEDKLLLEDTANTFSRGGKLAKLNLTSITSFARFPFLTVKEKLRLSGWVATNTLQRSRYDLSDPSTLVKADREDVVTFGQRVLGDNITEVILRSSVEPFWFFGASETSIALTKALSAHAAGSNIYILNGGIDQICSRLLSGLNVNLSTKVDRVEINNNSADIIINGDQQRYDKVVIATTASQAGSLINEDKSKQYPAPLLDFIKGQEYAANIHACYRIPMLSENNYRAIIPCDVGPRDIGDVAFQRTKRTGSEPNDEELFSVSLSDCQSRKMMAVNELNCFDEIWNMARIFVDFLPEKSKPFHISRRYEAIPMQRPGQYSKAVIAQEAQRNAHLPVRFCGDYFTLPWIEGALASAEAALFDL